MLSDLNDCIVALGAQQFRLHTSTRSTLLLHVSSFPIIEHCEQVRFGAYPFPAPGVSRHEEVQDFDWVRSGPSPHWSLLPSNQALSLREALQTQPTPPVSELLASIPASTEAVAPC